MKHIYDWIEEPAKDEGEALAKRFFDKFTVPAIDKDHAWLKANPLFCTYQGQRFRVTGASRLGDVWLSPDFAQENGYQHRVDVTDCSQWGAQP